MLWLLQNWVRKCLHWSSTTPGLCVQWAHIYQLHEDSVTHSCKLMGSLILRQVTCTSVPSVGEDDLEHLSFLPSPPERRGSRRVPPHLGYARLGADPGASCVLGKQSINSASQLRQAPFVSGLPFPRAYFHIIYWFPFLGKLLHIVLGSTPSRTLSSPKLIPFYLFTNFCFLPQASCGFQRLFWPIPENVHTVTPILPWKSFERKRHFLCFLLFVFLLR